MNPTSGFSAGESAGRGRAIGAEFVNNLRVGLLTGSIGGVLLGLLYGAATLVLNPELLHSVRDVLVLVAGLGLVYAAFCMALGFLGAVAKTALFVRSGQSLSDTKTAAFVTGAIFFAISALYGYQWCRWHRLGGLSPEGHPGLEDLPIVVAILAVAAFLARLLTYAFYLLIVHFKKPERAQPGDLRKAFLVLAYMAGAFAIFVLALRLGSSSAGSVDLNVEQIRPLDAPLRVLSIDGLSAADTEFLARSGRLGELGTLLHGGQADVHGVTEPIAPVTWTRVATGRRLEAHGIVDYQAQVVRGLSRPFTVGPNQVGLFQLFQDVLPFFRLTRPVPMRSYMRGSKAIWNVATEAGRSCAVVNWWISYPAEEVHGTVVSDQARLRLEAELGLSTASTGSLDPARMRAIRPQGETYPGSLLLEIAPLSVPDSASVPALQDATRRLAALGLPREVIASDLFHARVALHLLERDTPDLWMLHLPGPDVLRRLLRRQIDEPRAREAAFREAADAYWSVLGPVLRPLADVANDDGRTSPARTIWLSLPGWPLADEDAAVGRLVITGPGSRGTPLAPMELEEICPTLLWLLGLPYSAEMPGRPRTEVLTESAHLAAPVEVARFGPLRPPRNLPPTDPGMDRARLELLRSLGYIDD